MVAREPVHRDRHAVDGHRARRRVTRSGEVPQERRAAAADLVEEDGVRGDGRAPPAAAPELGRVVVVGPSRVGDDAEQEAPRERRVVEGREPDDDAARVVGVDGRDPGPRDPAEHRAVDRVEVDGGPPPPTGRGVDVERAHLVPRVVVLPRPRVPVAVARVVRPRVREAVAVAQLVRDVPRAPRGRVEQDALTRGTGVLGGVRHHGHTVTVGQGVPRPGCGRDAVRDPLPAGPARLLGPGPRHGEPPAHRHLEAEAAAALVGEPVPQAPRARARLAEQALEVRRGPGCRRHVGEPAREDRPARAGVRPGRR